MFTQGENSKIMILQKGIKRPTNSYWRKQKGFFIDLTLEYWRVISFLKESKQAIQDPANMIVVKGKTKINLNTPIIIPCAINVIKNGINVSNIITIPEAGSFLMNDKPEKLLTARMIEEDLNILVIWEKRMDGTKPIVSYCPVHELRKQCPQMLLDFYENRIIFQ
jgi:hypothetical protein